MEENEFLKLAYKAGKVEDVSKAFDEYLPEDEWHHGKIEEVLNVE